VFDYFYYLSTRAKVAYITVASAVVLAAALFLTGSLSSPVTTTTTTLPSTSTTTPTAVTTTAPVVTPTTLLNLPPTQSERSLALSMASTFAAYVDAGEPSPNSISPNSLFIAAQRLHATLVAFSPPAATRTIRIAFAVTGNQVLTCIALRAGATPALSIC
jgi:hypothetical protein